MFHRLDTTVAVARRLAYCAVIGCLSMTIGGNVVGNRIFAGADDTALVTAADSHDATHVTAAEARNIAAAEGTASSGRRPFETLFYMRDNEEAIASFREHAGLISIIGPQVFRVGADGDVRGGVDPRIVEIAAANGVRLMPLILNPGFDQDSVHGLLDDPAARAHVVATLVELAVAGGFWGWQFDFENVHQSYRDRLTGFYREAADALHAAGKTISIAVVPTDASPGDDPFSTYMQENWRNSFDVAALAEIGDFVSWMTYAQHAGGTTPGPVAGLPWMREMIEAALASGVPADKLSLGIPSYSDYWLPTFDETTGARVRGRDISHETALRLADAAGADWIWLPEHGVHYAFWRRNVTFDWLFLEDRRSFEAKLGLLDEYPGLHGVSVWVLGTEDPEVWEVLRARLDRLR